MILEQFKHLIDLLPDNEIEELSNLVRNKILDRARVRIVEGSIEPISATERELADRGNIVSAITDYNRRTRRGVLVSKLVIERYLGRW